MIEEWKNNFVFSTKWWLLLILTIFPWFLWWRIVNKSRSTEILLYGLFIISISTLIDIIGWSHSFWIYPNTLLGTCTPLLPIDYTLLPIAYMLVYQHFPKWKYFTLALLMMSFLFAFVLEPLAEIFSFYKPLKWHYVYSVPGYVLIGVFFKWLVSKIVKV